MFEELVPAVSRVLVSPQWFNSDMVLSGLAREVKELGELDTTT
jgi:hypothetical protein